MAVSAMLYGIWTIWKCRSQMSQLPALTVVAFLAAAVPVAQFSFGLIAFAGDAWLASMYLLGFALTAWFGYACAARFGVLRSMKPLQAVILAGAIASMWIALYQWLGLDYLGFKAINIAPGMRPYANVIQPNQLATLLALGVVAVAFLYEAGTIRGIGALSAIVFLAFGIAMTQSRSGLLEVFVVAAVLISRRSAARMQLGVRSIVIATCIVFAMPLAWEPLRGLTERSSIRDTAQMVSAGKRPIHWASLVDATSRRPWLGYGWGQVSEAQYDVALDHASTHETIAHSHNLALDLLVENGIPLGTLFIVALCAWFVLSIKRVRDAPTLLALCSVIAVFVHALLEFPLHYTYFLFPVGVFMGAVSWQTATGFTVRVPGWVAPVVLAAAVASTTLASREYFQMESDIQDNRFTSARIGSAKPIRLLHAHVFTQVSAYWNFAYTPDRRDLSAQDLEDVRRTTMRFTAKENLLRYAVLLAINGQGSKSSDVLRRICPMNLEAGCTEAELRWKVIGTRYPEVQAIPWPSPRPSDAVGRRPTSSASTTR